MLKHRKKLAVFLVFSVVMQVQALEQLGVRYTAHYRQLVDEIEPEQRQPVFYQFDEPTALINRPGSPPWGSDSWGWGSFDSPDWDIDLIGGLGFYDIDQLEMNQNRQEGDLSTLNLGLNSWRGPLNLRGMFYYSDFEGKGTLGTGIDQEVTGFNFKPGYRFLFQDDHWVNLDVKGILDMSYTTFTAKPSAWYFRPGLELEANRLTDFGLFRAAYSYSQFRNISGDKDPVTMRSYINNQAASLDYSVLVTPDIGAGLGLTYVTFEQAPIGMDDRLTDLNIRLGTAMPKYFNLEARYYTAIDGRSTQGFKINANYGFH